MGRAGRSEGADMNIRANFATRARDLVRPIRKIRINGHIQLIIHFKRLSHKNRYLSIWMSYHIVWATETATILLEYIFFSSGRIDSNRIPFQ
jgi:hypothetical protein